MADDANSSRNLKTIYPHRRARKRRRCRAREPGVFSSHSGSFGVSESRRLRLAEASRQIGGRQCGRRSAAPAGARLHLYVGGARPARARCARRTGRGDRGHAVGVTDDRRPDWARISLDSIFQDPAVCQAEAALPERSSGRGLAFGVGAGVGVALAVLLGLVQ